MSPSFNRAVIASLEVEIKINERDGVRRIKLSPNYNFTKCLLNVYCLENKVKFSFLSFKVVSLLLLAL